MEIALVPAENDRGDDGVALRHLAVAEVEVERADDIAAAERSDVPPEPEGIDADADIDLHADEARHHGNGISAAENLGRCHDRDREDVGHVFFLDAGLDQAVEDQPLGIALVVIGIVAHIDARHRRQHAGENIAIAFDPRPGAIFGGFSGLQWEGPGANSNGA